MQLPEPFPSFDRRQRQVVFLLLIFSLVASCADVDCDRELLEIFGDNFVFIGDVRDPGHLGIMEEHGTEPHSLPAAIEPNRIYLFHNTARLDHERFATVTLPARLSAIGAGIRRTPTVEDFKSPFLGGIIFTIQINFCHRHFAIGTLGPDEIFDPDGDYWFRYDYFVQELTSLEVPS